MSADGYKEGGRYIDILQFDAQSRIPNKFGVISGLDPRRLTKKHLMASKGRVLIEAPPHPTCRWHVCSAGRCRLALHIATCRKRPPKQVESCQAKDIAGNVASKLFSFHRHHRPRELSSALSRERLGSQSRRQSPETRVWVFY